MIMLMMLLESFCRKRVVLKGCKLCMADLGAASLRTAHDKGLETVEPYLS